MSVVYVDYLDEVYRLIQDRIEATEKKHDRKMLTRLLLEDIEPLIRHRDHEEYYQARLAGPRDVFQPNSDL